MLLADLFQNWTGYALKSSMIPQNFFNYTDFKIVLKYVLFYRRYFFRNIKSHSICWIFHTPSDNEWSVGISTVQ